VAVIETVNNSEAQQMRGRPFPKGVCPNPGGRPKGAKTNPIKLAQRDVKAMAQELSSKAMAALEAVLDNPKASPSAIVSAATAILDRACGRPAQSVDVTANVSSRAVTNPESAREFIALSMAERSASCGASPLTSPPNC
jgi:hypothetical protein